MASGVLVLCLLVAVLANGASGTLIQQNIGGSLFFNRSWIEFKNGFWDGTSQSFWLGNEKLHNLTRNGCCRLTVELESLNGTYYVAEYAVFLVDNEEQQYRLHIGGFTGNTSFDALYWHDSTEFTTFDRDHDHENTINCALEYAGGFWYNACLMCGVNSANAFIWYLLPVGDFLQSSRMFVDCA